MNLMRKTKQRTLRLTPETVAKAEELSKLWNPAPDAVAGISLADVVSTCIDRIHKEDIIPNKKFTCPHCGLKQTRVWPRESGNLCNQCQKPMDDPPTPNAQDRKRA